jgi:D-3-phosphoglycerate dehydrogenase
MRIAITDGLHPDAIAQLLAESGGDVAELEPTALEESSENPIVALIVRSRTKVTAEMLASLPSLRVVGRAGVGVDNIDLAAATVAGVRVVNAPRASTHSVVELTMAHLLASARFLAPSDRAMRDGRWIKKQAKGTELAGKRLGLVGYGRIARGVAAVASAFGMEVHAYDPYLPQGVDIAPAVHLHAELDDLFRNCTHISLHCGLTPETHHMVDARRLALMPNVGADGVACGAHVVKCARGGLIDEEAAATALAEGTLSTLSLDVFEHEPVSGDHPLLSHDRFSGTPHIGASTHEAQRRVGMDIADAVLETLATGSCSTVVNRDVL